MIVADHNALGRLGEHAEGKADSATPNSATTSVLYKDRLLSAARHLASASADPAPDWSEPGDLTPALLPVPVFDGSLVPPALRQTLEDVAHRMQCPLDWLAVTWLVMLGAVIGNRCGIRPKQLDTGWLEVPNLWGAIVAAPSKLKTPAIKAALVPLEQLDGEARAEFSRNKQLYEAGAEVLKAKRDTLKKRLSKAADKGDEPEIRALQNYLADLNAEPIPAAQRYLVNDSTMEKLVEILAANPRGLMVFRDELTGLLNGWEKQGRETERQFYLEAWNGTSNFSSDRIGRGSQFVPNCCISLLGGIQPDKIGNYLHQMQRGGNDGMLQRLSLVTWPDPRPFRYVDVAPNKEAQAAAVELLRRFDSLEPVAAGAVLLDGDSIPAFHFDAAAQGAFVSWLTAWQTGLEKDEEQSVLVQHFTKYRKLYPTLALLFHLLDVVSGVSAPGPVTAEAARLAERWCTYFAAHARRLYAYGARNGDAAALGKHLLADHLPSPFTAREVYRKGWQNLNTPAAAKSALEELVDNNWIREVALPAAVEGGRPPDPAYEINPRLATPTP